jgi:hypothetical protein
LAIVKKKNLVKLLLALTVVVTLLLSIAAPALADTKTTYYPYWDTATVDGSIGEWNLAQDCSIPMYRSGQNATILESTAYLRYDFTNHILYVLVLSEPGVEGLAPSWGAIDTINNKVFSSESPTPDAQLGFAWVNIDGSCRGYEAAFTLAPGTTPYDFYVHLQVNDGRTGYEATGQTSSTHKEGNSSLVAIDIVDPGVPAPEMPAAALLGLGLAGIGAFFIIQKRRATAVTR